MFPVIIVNCMIGIAKLEVQPTISGFEPTFRPFTKHIRREFACNNSWQKGKYNQGMGSHSADGLESCVTN